MDRSNERFEAKTKYLKNFSYGDRTYSVFLNQGSLFIELHKQSPDRFIFEFLKSDNIAKCKILKVFHNVAGTILQNILISFTVGKIDSETLETYALGNGMTSKQFEDHFNDDKQMNVIRQNPDYKNFDLTLKFKCILIFIDFNQEIFKNERQKENFICIIKELKDIRNDFSHNRDNYTGCQYDDLAFRLKFILGDLIEIMQTWDDANIDVLNEKEKTRTAIDDIMTGVMNYDDFRYMCLLNVMDLVVEPTLNTANVLICNKKGDETYKNYFSKNGINGKAYKDKFFPKEKLILEGKSEDKKPDITLHVKLIDICKEWHPALMHDLEAKEELGSITKTLRDIRNHILHNILSMSPNECTIEAHKIANILIQLGNFIQNKKLYMNLDVPIIDTIQINSHINFIIHQPYPYSNYQLYKTPYM